MNKLYIIVILLISCNIAHAQNLVPNGDFESYYVCPNAVSDFYGYVYDWINPSTGAAAGTPDYYNACATGAEGVPINHGGSQTAHSGVAYCGIVIARESTNTDFREYIEAPLTAILSAGACYHFQMYMNLGSIGEYSSGAIGAYFSTALISGYAQVDTLPYIPQIINADNNMPDSTNWLLVQGDYTAAGGEIYLIIGNFKSHDHTTTALVNSNGTNSAAYVYIDDVSLTAITCANGIDEPTKKDPVLLYPNPTQGSLKVEMGNNEPSEIKLYDATSRLLLFREFRNSISVNMENFTAGVYFYEIRSSGGEWRAGKIVRN